MLVSTCNFRALASQFESLRDSEVTDRRGLGATMGWESLKNWKINFVQPIQNKSARAPVSARE